jgi:VIT1/CCC1 family predicted Fe2+/Mn2+ transporter
MMMVTAVPDPLAGAAADEAAARGRSRAGARASAARAAVFGVSDGLVSNVSLTLGVAGAHSSPAVVRLTGLAALVAGACSMASGEYLSSRAHVELLRRELDVERLAHISDPDAERAELVRLYASRGLSPELADVVAGALMADPEIALAVHAREELGLDPARLGSPPHAAFASFASFALGAAVPLGVWSLASGTAGVELVVAVALLASVALGLALGVLTGRSPARFVARQVLLSAAAAAVTYGVARVAGVGAAG